MLLHKPGLVVLLLALATLSCLRAIAPTSPQSVKEEKRSGCKSSREAEAQVGEAGAGREEVAIRRTFILTSSASAWRELRSPMPRYRFAGTGEPSRVLGPEGVHGGR